MKGKEVHSKDFEGWSRIKQKIDAHDSIPIFHEREIWWCSIGVNFGFEIYGKSDIFTRPVLIVKKFSPSTFLGLPLSTKSKKKRILLPYYFQRRNCKRSF